MKKLLTFAITLFICLSATASDMFKRDRIELGGKWAFALDRDSTGYQKGYATAALGDEVTLPGTTDTNMKGDAIVDKTVTTHLSRPYSYFGKAWYQRVVNIPKDWKKKNITMYLERTKPTTIYIDGKKAGACDDVSVPHIYDLTEYLTPGKHTIAIMVDNGYSVPRALLGSSHAYTEDTQTNWNGIIGKMYLEATSKVLSITSLRTMPQKDLHTVDIEMTIKGKIKSKYFVHASAEPSSANGSSPAFMSEKISALNNITNADGTTTLRFTMDLGKNAAQWNEFHANIYNLTVILSDDDSRFFDSYSTTVGLRSFEAKGNHFYVNGRQTFLRGKHDACVFPLTGHVPMDYDSWYHYLNICKEYGINHVRFHSWCPPEACFEAADALGIYLQPELPIWGSIEENDQYLISFLTDEGRKIISQYGNHPSFVMMGLGNELWGSSDKMAEFLSDFRSADNMKGDSGKGRRLYTFGSNMYLGYKGYFDAMDYFTTCRIGGEAWGRYDTHVRGSFSFADAFDGGLINHEYPNTTTNFEKAINGCPMPVISHETGQFQTYPDYNEIKKYTGVLKPYNMEIFRDRLHKAGMASQAEKFHISSGEWSMQLYKADIEMDLRTANMGGFQLLDLQDYPGQGSAYVGVLDAFMEKKGLGKGLVSAEEWRGWCSPVVPMAELTRLTYNDGDTIRWTNLIANYGETDDAINGKPMEWAIIGDNNRIVANGAYGIINIKSGLNRMNTSAAIASLQNKDKAEQLKLVLTIKGTDYKNYYNLWLYPSTDYQSRMPALSKGITITDTLTADILAKLDKGAKVLLMPKQSMYHDQTIEGLVQTDYWNYRMFKTICENNNKPVSPGTLGLLINDMNHPLMQKLPIGETTGTTWQWAAVAHQARPLIMDIMNEGYCPLVQVVDNIERNHRLGMIFEFTVGKGKLLVCMSDLNSIAQYPETRHLHLSILEYMQSESFSPASTCDLNTLVKLFSTKADGTNIQELRNISYD